MNRAKKYVKVNSRPLSQSNAKDRMAYFVDNTLSARGKIKAVGKKKTLGKITKKEKGARKTIIVRQYKLVKGKRVPIRPNKVIERKGKPRLNTRGEKKGITVARLKKKLVSKKKVGKKRVTRKKTTRTKKKKK